MRRIHKTFAVVASSVLLTLALTAAALAAGSVRAGIGGAAGRAVTRPNVDIKGRPPHWSPTMLTAKARWGGGSADCNPAGTSFTITDMESKPQHITITGNNGFARISGTLAKGRVHVCVPRGYHGTAHAKLRDGKKLTIRFP